MLGISANPPLTNFNPPFTKARLNAAATPGTFVPSVEQMKTTRMKMRFLLSAITLSLAMTACQKEDADTAFAPEPQPEFAPPAEDRCGCLAPEEHAVINATGTSAEITWNNMPETTGYQLEIVERSRGFNGEVRVMTTESTQMTVTGLRPATAYRFRVTSMCRNEDFSSPSAWVEFNSGQSPRGDYPVIPFETAENDPAHNQ